MSKEHNLEDKDKVLHIGSVISRLSDEKLDNIIYELDEYARDYNGYEYGLPTHGEHIEKMRHIVKVFLNGL